MSAKLCLTKYFLYSLQSYYDAGMVLAISLPTVKPWSVYKIDLLWLHMNVIILSRR